MPKLRKQKTLIENIENIRKSRVLVYVTGDRKPFSASIADDVVRPMYDHLLDLEKIKPSCGRLDLFIYSRGGDVSVPWRMVSMFRQVFKEFCVLIPYRAHSAATMISLGADKIVMGRKAELGPIDPTLVRENAGGGSTIPPSEVSVEDVSSYISFIKERAGISDQSALARLVGKLSDNLTPLVIGSVNRQHSHIRLVARKLLASHLEKIDEERLSSIVEALTEKMYSHGHAIGRREAKEVGLPIEDATGNLEKAIMNLFIEYEKELNLDQSLDLETSLGDREELVITDLALAIVESRNMLHKFAGDAFIKRKRNVPNNPQINVNMQVGLPSDITPEQVPAEAQQALRGIMQQITNELPAVVQKEIAKQSPTVGIGARMLRGKWVYNSGS